MQPRQIGIAAVAALVAFAVAFGIGKASGGSDNKANATSPSAPKAASTKQIELGSASVSGAIAASAATAAIPI